MFGQIFVGLGLICFGGILFRRPNQLVQQMAMQLTEKQRDVVIRDKNIEQLTALIAKQHEYIKELNNYRLQSKAKLDQIAELLPSIKVEELKESKWEPVSDWQLRDQVDTALHLKPGWEYPKTDRPAAVIMYQKVEDIAKLLEKQGNAELAKEVMEILSR